MPEIDLPYPNIKVPLDLFEKLDDNKLHSMANLLNDVEFPIKKSDLLALISQNIELPKKALDDFLLFFSLAINNSDSYDKFKEAIKGLELTIDDESVKFKFNLFFNSLTKLEAFFEQKRLEYYSIKANNYFLGMEYACDLRGRYKSEFNYKNYPIEEFDPEVIDFVPLVMLQFRFSDGINQNLFNFQAEVNELDEIITNLLAAQKELRKLTGYLKSKKE